MSKLPYAVGALALGLAACGGEEPPAGEPAASAAPVEVSVVAVDTQLRTERIEVSGTVRAADSADIAARVMGHIQAIPVSEGSRVRAGATLVEIDNRELRSALEAAQAARESAASAIRTAESGIAAAEAQEELAQATYKRYATLFEKQSLTQQELDEASARLRQAEAAVESARSRKQEAESHLAAAEAQVRSAEVAVGHTRVVAPFAGVVTDKLMDPGSLAAPGQPILRLEKAGRYRLEVAVPESQTGAVRVGATVPVAIEAVSDDLEGRVAEIVPAVDPASRTFVAKIDLPARPGLRAGLYGRAFLEGGEREVVTAPAEAISETGQLRSALVVEGEVARKRLVKLGERRDGYYEVLSGLEPGELVVVSGDVADGARVTARRIDR